MIALESYNIIVKSLSARRAWIEIALAPKQNPTQQVALRKESVDRNSDGVVSGSGDYVSLSARRAWIEIIDDLEPSTTRRVALRKESVDRNWLRCWKLAARESLSARRAWIEILSAVLTELLILSLSARRAWIEMLYQLYDTYAKVSLSARRAWIEIQNGGGVGSVGGGRSPQGERG